MDCPSCEQFVLASIFHNHHKFVKIANWGLQCWRLVKTPTMLKILSVSISDLGIPKICRATKDRFRNHASWIFHQVRGNTKFFSFTCKCRNKFNSFINNLCKVTSFEVTAPKMESSSPSIGVVSVRPSKFGFKNHKTTTNKSSKVLLSYFATICITFSHPTNVFITLSNLKCGSNISANFL